MHGATRRTRSITSPASSTSPTFPPPSTHTHRVRIMMKMHSLNDASYWIISYAWCLTLCLLFFSLLWAIGALCGLTMFVQTQKSLQVVWCGGGSVCVGVVVWWCLSRRCVFADNKTPTHSSHTHNHSSHTQPFLSLSLPHTHTPKTPGVVFYMV